MFTRMAATFAAFTLAAPVLAAPLTVQDTLGTFNLVTETYAGQQEVEGRSFIDSTITGVTGQFGFNAPNDGTGYVQMYVNGDIVNSNIKPNGGSVHLSGTLQNSIVENGTAVQNATGFPDVDFASYLLESQYAAGLSGVAADVSDQNNKKFGGANIVNVSLSDLASGSYSLEVSGTGTTIINVSGTSGSFGMNSIDDNLSKASSFVWNFYEATDIQVNSAIYGHVLAPLAHMSGFNGSTEGSVIARQVTQNNGELHQLNWVGLFPEEPVDPAPPTNPIPLPAGLPLVLTGLGAFAVLRRWKR